MRRRYILLIVANVMALASIAQSTLSDSVLDIYTCRQMALEHNHNIKIAKHKYKIADYSRKSAITKFLPSVDLTGQYIRTNNPLKLLNENMFMPIVPFWAIDAETHTLKPDILENPLLNGILIDPETGKPMYDSDGNPVFLQYGYLPKEKAELSFENVFIANAGIVQPIYLGGKLRANYRIQKILMEMQTQKTALTEDEVIQKVEEMYWKIVDLYEKQKLANAYSAMLEKLVEDLENLKMEGIITGNDVLKAKIKYNEVSTQQFQVKNGINLAYMALNQLIGSPLDSKPTLEKNILPVQIYSDKDAMIQSALVNRPELEMLGKSVELAGQGVKLAWSRFLPIVAFTANYTMLNPSPYNAFEKEFGGDFNFGVTCRIPITKWGDRIFTLNSAKEMQTIAMLKEEETKEMISLQVQQTWNAYLEAFKQVEVKQLNVDYAEENLRVENNRFQEGMSKVTDLLEAHAMWQKASTALLEARTDLRKKEIEIKKSTGQL